MTNYVMKEWVYYGHLIQRTGVKEFRILVRDKDTKEFTRLISTYRTLDGAKMGAFYRFMCSYSDERFSK